VIESLKEFFTLRAAAALAEALPPEAREPTAARLRLARQHDAAARDLWACDHRADALRLARGALAETLEAAASVPHDGADPRGLLEGELPALDEEVAEVHARRFHAMRAARRRLDAALTAALYTRRDLRGLRSMRTSLLAGGLALAGAGLIYWRTRPPTGAATASAFLPDAPGFDPSRAVDGDAYTEWLLPTQQKGWLDLTFPYPRATQAVRVLNAHNRQANDMATRDYRVEAYAGDRVVGRFQGAFPTLEAQPEWYRLPMVAEGVTRVRLWVDGFHRSGGGFAEVRVE